MLRVYDCIATEHDLRLVVLAALTCLFACYTALSLLDRSRAAANRPRLSWLTGAAAVFGCGVWTTHFVAMLAFRSALPIGYDLGLTVLSIALAIGIAWVGFFIALRGGRAVMLGGAIAGAAVGVMHFVGMAALRVPAALSWDTAYVIAALTIGIVLGAYGLNAHMRVADHDAPRARIAGAGLLALAIVGLHFIAMTAVTLAPDPRIPMPTELIAPEWLAIAIAAVTLMILALGLFGSVVDQHFADRSMQEAERLRRHVAELEATRQQLEETAASLTKALEAAAASSQAKSQFLATMSHELRTPLNAVIGFSDLIAAEAFGPMGDPRYSEYAQCICDSGAHLLGLINDVLDISKLDAGRLQLQEEEISLAHIVEDALRMVARQADTSDVRLEKRIEAALPNITADARRVRQVVLNLLSNAVKFTPKGGIVTATVFRQGDGIAVAVSDNGIGIAPEDIPRALERFGQIDDRLGRQYEGTGLGLPLSKCLMELHGGTLDMASEVGVGTTVTIAFPPERIAETRAAA